MQSFTLDQNTLDILATFTANNKQRPALAGVNVIINDDDTITLASTDSYRMHKTIVKKISNTFPNYAPFFVDTSSPSDLPYASIEKLIQVCKLAIAMDKKRPAVTLSNTRVQYGCYSKPLSDYPENILINLSHSETVKLDANFLLDLLKKIVLIKKEIGVTPTVTIQNESPLSKVMFTFCDHEHIIMPLK